MPLAANAHPPTSVALAGCAAVVPPAMVAQPGPSPVPATVTEYAVPLILAVVPPRLVAPTANALEFKSESAPRKFRMVNDGVSVQKLKGCRRPPTDPPTANESWPAP